MAIDFDFLRKRLESGILFYAGARLTREISNRWAKKYLKEHSDAIVGIGSAVALEALGEKAGKMRTYLEDIVDAMSDYGIYKEALILAEKVPECWAQDANTIVCKNFDDLANAEVFIDGVKKTSSQDYNVSGDQIQLTTALGKGEHDLVVVDGTGKKSFSGKIYV